MADLPNPGYDADMLRRAATACRNYVRQAGMPTGEGEWFDWVPKHLDQLADRLDPDPVDSGRGEA